jgi:hypothetical protein
VLSQTGTRPGDLQADRKVDDVAVGPERELFESSGEPAKDGGGVRSGRVVDVIADERRRIAGTLPEPGLRGSRRTDGQ